LAERSNQLQSSDQTVQALQSHLVDLDQQLQAAKHASQQTYKAQVLAEQKLKYLQQEADVTLSKVTDDLQQQLQAAKLDTSTCSQLE